MEKQQESVSDVAIKRKMTQQSGLSEQKEEDDVVYPQKSPMVKAVHRSFSGPLPAPEDYRAYEQICPGAADRILKMAETQQAHRINLENMAMTADVQDVKRGQIFAFVIGIVSLIGGFLLIAIGKDAIGISAVIGTIATLVGIYIYGRISDANEDKNKKK